ncbi:CapA family protein [Candidatus Aquicultor sp.]
MKNAFRKTTTPPPQPKKPTVTTRYAVATNLSSNRENIPVQELVRLFRDGKVATLKKDRGELPVLFKSIQPNTVREASMTATPIDTFALLKVDDLPPGLKVLTVDGKSVWDDGAYPLVARVEEDSAAGSFNVSKVVKMTAVGDIILGRTVYRRMAEKGYTAPFSNVAPRLKKADITFGDLESPLSNAFTPPIHGMQFLAPTAAIQGLTLSGIDIVGLANNHSTNFGPRAFSDTLDVLKKNNIAYVGGGSTEAEAKSFKILTVKNKRFAFLDFNSIIGDMEARGTSPGDWHISLQPWGAMNQNQVDEVIGKVRQAEAAGDFTVVMAHWSQEYIHDPNQDRGFSPAQNTR